MVPMKWMTIVIFVLATGLNQNAPRFEQSQAKAASQNKPLLLIFSGSDWCRPCINFKRVVLDDPTFKTYADSNLVVFVADIPRDQNLITAEELAENKELAARYNEKGTFPYLVLFNPEGEIIRERPGAFGSFEMLKQWIEK